jgi:tetratricopeptide (TPR) repeat protein
MEALRPFKILFLCALVHFSCGCASTRSIMQRGDYVGAVEHAVQMLNKTPDDAEEAQLLRSSYHLANEINLTQAEAYYTSASDLSRYDEKVIAYEKLQRVYRAISSSPTARNIVGQPTSYFSQLEQAKLEAAEAYYDVASRLLEDGSRENAKAAVAYYQKAQNYQPSYKDSLARQMEAIELASYDVVLLPVLNRSREKFDSYQFESSVLSLLNSGNDSQFVRYQREDPYALAAKPEELLQLTYEGIRRGNTDTSSEVQHFSHEETVGDSIVLHKATVTIYQRKTTDTASLLLQYLDPDNRSLRHQLRVQERYTSSSKWATLRGNESALAGHTQIKRLLDKTAPVNSLSASKRSKLQKKLLQKAISALRQRYESIL